MKKKIKALFSLILIIISLFSFSISAETKSDDCLVRIYLKRLSLTKYLDIGINGVYSILADGTSISAKRNMQIKLRIVENNLVLYTNGITLKLGNSVVFKRHSVINNVENGLRLNNSNNLYTGDLHIGIVDNNINAILHLPVEEYLLGVVPFEMSDSFPIEALKAQAIAARTYAIKHLNPKNNFDLYDTTKDQVYKGFNSEYTNSAEAVKSTNSICSFVNNQLATCFYSGSNGGQTELPINKWGKRGDSDCYAMVDDNYDIKNKSSLVASYTLKKQLHSNKHDPAQALICKYLIPFAKQAGFDSDIENLRIDKIKSLALTSPKYPSPSRVYTILQIKLSFSGKKELPTNAVSPVPTNTPEPTPTPFVYTFIKPSPIPNNQKNLSDFIPFQNDVEISLPIFNEVISAFGLGLRGGGFELLSINQSDAAFKLESRRFGHGVGMSQRGAQQMAKEGKSYIDILAFYYPGAKLESYKNKVDYKNFYSINKIDELFVNTPEPLPSATPLPSPIPLLWDVPSDVKIAKAVNIDEVSYLNLRQKPSLESAVVRKLYYGQELVVVDFTEDKAWVHVIINKDNKDEFFEGYVASEFVEIIN